jgi:tRNA pseudouridine55 synthase
MKDNEDGTFDFRVRVVCSTGTYVRTLAEDFGSRLGVGAHLAELRRTRVGEFSIDAAVTLDELKSRFAEEALGTVLVPPSAALSHLPFLHLTDNDARRARHGMEVEVTNLDWTDGTNVKLCDAQGTLISVGVYNENKRQVHPRVVIDTA